MRPDQDAMSDDAIYDACVAYNRHPKKGQRAKMHAAIDAYLAKMPKALSVSNKDMTVFNLWDEKTGLSFGKEIEALEKGGSVVKLVALVEIPEGNDDN